MHQTEQKIIALFRKENNELSTSNILEQIDENYSKLRNQLGSCSPDYLKKLKYELAQSHRRTLHHINKLVELGVLRLTRHGERGEKFFSLNLSDNEEIIVSGLKKRVLVSKPIIPTMPIEGYEQKAILSKYETATWIDRLNSVIIRCELVNSAGDLYNILSEDIFPLINDSICLDCFENIINKENVSNFIEKINSESEEYGKKISFIINLSNIKHKENFSSFLSLIDKKPKNIVFIFNLNSNELQEFFELFKKIVEIYSKNKMPLFIKNKNIFPAPYFLGRAGPYCIDIKEWLSDDIKNKICIACSQSSIIIDVNKFYLEYGLDVRKFSEMLLNISKSILSANSLQRRKSEEYFKNIILLNSKRDFLEISRNYIRFWNFGLSQPDIEQDFVLNMISEAKKKIDNFSIAEEIIYNSCGMPTRFRLAFSCAFRQADEKLSPAKFEKLEIKNLEELYKSKLKKEMIAREIVSSIFDGGNDVNFFRTGTFNADDVIREINVILNTYKIPLFSYDFEKIKTDLKLSDFLK